MSWIGPRRIGRRLDREGIRVTDLAEQAGVTKQTACALVDGLEAEWRAHLGAKAYDESRAALVSLRDVTDPYP
jgi:DNA-binding MarR family transcriptional regulator